MGLFQRIFSRRTELEPADLSVLGADIHSHLIPGIDDGAATLEDSIILIEQLQAFGYRKLITTPHVMSDYYRNGPHNILPGLETLRKALKEKGISIELEAAAEYYLDEAFPGMLERGELLSFGNKYVLFEMGFMSESPNLKEVLFELQLAGYKPVLAHPERYPYWFQAFSKIVDLHDKGVILQLNINSLTGAYGPEVRKNAEKMVELNLVSFLGSDCHHIGHVERMDHARKSPHLHKLLASGKLMNSSLI